MRTGATTRTPTSSAAARTLKDLKELLDAKVVGDVDHKNLNLQVEWLKGIIPSSENFAVAIWNRIEPHMPEGVRLSKVALYETPRHFVEYSGDEGG